MNFERSTKINPSIGGVASFTFRSWNVNTRFITDVAVMTEESFTRESSFVITEPEGEVNTKTAVTSER